MPRLRPVPLLLCALALAAAPAVAHADEVLTRTGARYEGEVVADEGTHLVFEAKGLGTLRIPKVDVLRVKTGASAPADGPSKGGAAAPSPAPAPAEPAGASGSDPKADPKADAEAAAAEAARLAAENEARDASERIQRRRRASLRRRTDPAQAGAAPAAAAVPAADTHAAEREAERAAISAASLASTPAGTQVIVFEPPRPFAAAPSGISLGRRTYARLEMCGAATALFTVKVGETTERLTLRLADVQRHVVAKSETSRVRVLEGVSEGDWLRLRLSDGTFVSGRFASLDEPVVRLTAPTESGRPQTVRVDAGRIVQIDGLIAAGSVGRALADLEAGEPVGIVNWPDGAEVCGRFVDREDGQVRIDADGDGEGETTVSVLSPIAEVRRIPPAYRATLKSAKPDAVFRVRGSEQYADARVERVVAGRLAAVTAWALSLRTEDGCAVFPFEGLVGCEPGTRADMDAARNRIEPAAMRLPVVPGMPAAEAKALELPAGVTFVTDGRTVTHVYVAPPWERPVCGLQVGERSEHALAQCDLRFGIEVVPKQADSDRSRELVSDTIDGLRLTAYVDRSGVVDVLEIARRAADGAR